MSVNLQTARENRFESKYMTGQVQIKMEADTSYLTCNTKWNFIVKLEDTP